MPEFLGDDGVVAFGCAERGGLGVICASKDRSGGTGARGAELSVYSQLSQGWQLVRAWVTASGWARANTGTGPGTDVGEVWEDLGAMGGK